MNIDLSCRLRFCESMETPAPSQTPPAPAPAPPPTSTAIKKSTLSKVLPSDRLTFDRQIEALKAYVAEYEANGGKPVTNLKAGEIGKMAAATIVVTNAFFTDIGLLTRSEEGFIPSSEAVGYLRAVHGLCPESASDKLKPLFDKQWFSQVLIPRLRLRTMDLLEVVKVLGEEASAGKEHIQRLELLIEFMAFVGVIRKEGNQISLPTSTPAPPLASPPVPSPQAENGQKTNLASGHMALPIPLDARSGRNAILHFPEDLNDREVLKLINFIKLSFDYQESQGT